MPQNQCRILHFEFSFLTGEKKDAEFNRVLCIIMTDGEENASHMITSAGVRNLMKTKEGEGKWTFVYIGENPEKWARETGTSVGNVVAYEHRDTGRNFRLARKVATSYRSCSRVQQDYLMQNAQEMDDSPPRYSQLDSEPESP